EIQYAKTRLVAGLSSNQAWSGYGTAVLSTHIQTRRANANNNRPNCFANCRVRYRLPRQKRTPRVLRRCRAWRLFRNPASPEFLDRAIQRQQRDPTGENRRFRATESRRIDEGQRIQVLRGYWFRIRPDTEFSRRGAGVRRTPRLCDGL